MSAYGHQMDREYNSSHSVSSFGGSDADMGSRYDSGFYVTSFAATIFIGALITVGVLLMTLLIALTVMLQSCETKSSGIVEHPKSVADYSDCYMYSLHMELNSFEVVELPAICENLTIHYIKDGQYERDLNSIIVMVERYVSSISLHADGLDVVLMDADDMLPSNSHSIDMYRSVQYSYNNCFEEAKRQKHKLLLRLYIKLQTDGWSLILLSRKPEKDRYTTMEQLTSAGYKDRFSLIMRSDDEMQMDNREYFSRGREDLQKAGLRIKALISSKMDAITGPFSGKRVFKLPNPIFYTFEDQSKSTYPQK